MVHPNFVNQQVPRPNRWEVPSLAQLADFWTTPTTLRDSISDRFRHVLLGFQHNARRPLICFLRAIPDFVGLAEWEPHRLLGAGGFGVAGLWERRDAQGNTRDEMVVKRTLEETINQTLFYMDHRGRRKNALLAEAVVQKLVNEQQCGNIVHLRGYKFSSATPLPGTAPAAAGNNARGGRRRRRRGRAPDPSNEYRLYMEYAPYGSLERLKTRYRAWSQWLPEAFLWHLFACLIQSCVAMMSKPADQTLAGRKRKWHADAEVVHLDIKPNNIFLGYETPMAGYNVGGGENLPYPIAQLGDYGLAEVTHWEDIRNPKTYWDAGTKYYKTPEMIHYGTGFAVPPNGYYRPLVDQTGRPHDIIQEEEDDDDPGFRMLGESNIWAIGKVMYDLATLSDSATFQHHWSLRENEYNANNNHCIPDFQQAPFHWSVNDLNATNPYSQLLMSTISRCLEPAIDDRIAARDLFRIVNREVQSFDHDRTHRDARYPAGSVKRRRLYYNGNEINDMPLGTVNFETSQAEWDEMMEDWTVDPAWRDLSPPVQKWQAFINPAGGRRGRRGGGFGQARDTRNRFIIRQGRIWFANPPAPPANTLRRGTRVRRPPRP